MRFPLFISQPKLARRDGSAIGGTALELDGLGATRISMDEDGPHGPSFTLTFDVPSADRIAAFTTAHAGVRVQFLVDGTVVFEPRLMAPITDGVVVARMGSGDQVERLVARLRVPGVTIALRIVH